MSLIDQARADILAITTNSNEFAQDITFTSIKDPTTVTVKGIANKIFLNVDTQGNPINSKNVTVAVSEQALLDVGYPVRNSDNEVQMTNDLVTTKDNSGIDKNYQISSKMPDETVGLLVFILEDYEAE